MDIHRDVLQRVISIENPPKRQRLIGDPPNYISIFDEFH
jgi:hypothetical protein